MRSSRAHCSLAAEFLLVQENIAIQSERITQLYVIQSERDPFLWFGVLFVDSGFYLGSVIRFTMIIDDSYPDCSCPKIVFDQAPYHPLVDPETGQLDTKNAFPDWNSNSHKLHQLLLFVKRTMCQMDTYIKRIQELISQHQPSDTSNVNPPAEDNDRIALDPTRFETNISKEASSDDTATATGISRATYDQSLIDIFFNFDNTLEVIKTYESDPDEFSRRVDRFKQDCCHQLFEKPRFGDDPNAILFSPWIPEVHEPIRSCVLAGRLRPPNLFASYHKDTNTVAFVPGSEPP